MPPKRENSKAVAARERKAAQAAEKVAADARVREAQEAAEWKVGSKDNSKALEKDAKRRAQLDRRREREALEEKEANEVVKLKPIKNREPRLSRSSPPPAVVPVNPSKAILTGSESSASLAAGSGSAAGVDELPDTFAASGIDGALELLTLVDETRPAGGANHVLTLDRHPERRVAAAYRAFEERELPALRKEFPSLRRTQLLQRCREMFDKSPENPMNQASLAYNATPEEARQATEALRASKLEGYRH
ncbi:hypothetical protein H696_02486 [Fonticula alba]|uniref:HMG box domain-containing protein n=1 Tax=Fonticula alba TaxID=691883 RepID=A0A058ZDK9_FONAL|nr:hypothetical protein H696_02486 [Fonticula alba]KCV71547.1 hypothetical protein H696_02486 [Fonticula alba]|eukprot:XP_009494670.1 hypothetical protein H696_02486 [Fonticula alba]